MFGTSDTALLNDRNALFMHGKLEEAFDNSWFTIIPPRSITANPTEWKVVFLDPGIQNKIFYEQ